MIKTLKNTFPTEIIIVDGIEIEMRRKLTTEERRIRKCAADKKYYNTKGKQMKHKLAKNNKRPYKPRKSRRFVNLYKYICGCTICGYKHSDALDLHHIDKTQKVESVSIMLNQIGTKYSMQDVKEEIRKCAVLCANCHRGVHSGRIVLKQSVSTRR
jgi:hypothetical protein